MVVALNVDYENVSALPEAVENSVVATETPDSLVVNVHANYVIDEAERYEDRTFPHMLQMHLQTRAADEYGSLVPASYDGINRGNMPRPLRRPDFADEWQLLKKAWSLHSRGRDKLADKELAAASERFHSDDPLNDLPDWIWRFCMYLGAQKYEVVLRAMMGEIREGISDGRLTAFLDEHASTAATRARRYFEVLRDYFAGWGEFSQVHFAVAKGMPVLEGHVATTSGFNAVRMFYGSAFEAFASSVDILAFMNNVLEGRDWDRFRNVDAETYLKSDKAKRFDAFADRKAFSDLCEERDSGLRNASHHGALHFDADEGGLAYRSGKGNTGELVTLSYAQYLSRSSALFFQMVTLLRFELLICQNTKRPFPI